MIKLLAILLLPLSLIGQRLSFTGSIGYSQTPVTSFAGTYRASNHTVTAAFQPNITNEAKYSMGTASINYGYIIRTWQPYIGYSTQGLTYGINKYLNQCVIGAGMQGKNPVLTLGVTTLRGTGKDIFTGNDYVIMGTQFLSGFARGFRESIQAGHWGEGKPFFDMQTSWKRKWKNGNKDEGEAFLGSSTVFVFLTDGYHLSGTISNVANVATLTFALSGKEKKNFKTIAKKVLISLGSNAAGFYLAYDKAFK